jgi:multidrug resistance efflux pump
MSTEYQALLVDTDEFNEPTGIVVDQAPKDHHVLLADIDESNEQIRVVLGQVPNAFLRWGTSVILCCLLILIALCWYIKYPDVVIADIVITTKNPPITVVSRANGKLSPLLVGDHEKVQIGQILAVIENAAYYKDVYALLQVVANLTSLESATLPVFSPNSSWRLGEVQESYHTFEKSYQNWRLYQILHLQTKEIASLQKQREEYSRMLDKQQGQQQLYEEELQLASNIFERDKQAFERKLIAATLFEQKQKELLQTIRQQEDIKSQISATKVRIEELQNAILNRTLDKQRAENEYRQTLMSRLNALKTSISQWEETYVLKAPIGGKVTFFTFWSENQFVKNGEEVMAVVPDEEANLVGKVSMPLNNSGKVKDGNKVLIRLQNYPYREFGVLVGTVKSIALIPKNNAYAIEVELHNSLKTTFNKTLEFRQEMQGSAEIITEDLRLIERLFYQVLSLMNLEAHG